MISSIKGILSQITDDYALVEIGGMYYEVLLPSALAERLKTSGSVGNPIEFRTIYYIEAGDKKSSHYPRLVGFTDSIDREFFSLLTQVPGMGIKKALKSLILPIRDIATAIETKDAGTLNRLPGVGGRLADKIIAELHGKTTKFALARTDMPLAKKDTRKDLGPIEQEAIEVLMQLQYRRQEAEEMIARAVKAGPKVTKVEDLISMIFRNERQTRG